jgi:hypothetical protein
MKIEMSYLVKLENGTNAWLAVGKEIPAGAVILEERPMLIPDEGLFVKHKVTGNVVGAHWLREGSIEDWEEVPEPKEEEVE